ncbi:protein yellow-like [Euwallacea similis]|uniref:protein yellow-like n=1 Tax=Euwallacea similis TaxID=1736056 RepID=UPI00344B4A2F
MLTTQFFGVAVFCLFAISGLSSAKFRVIREWNYLNFTWRSAEMYQKAVQQQLYIPENNIIAGLKYFEGFYYITLPRMKSGVPATLTRIPSGFTNDTTPLLMPFPSWEKNELNNCDAVQNVQNVEIDPMKGHIWIIDGGRTNTLGSSPVTKCQPKLLVYDIRKMEEVLSYTFPEHVASFNGSFLYDIVLDNTEQGYAYISDNSGRDPGIIVFSIKDHQAWKIRHSQSMHADPNAVAFHVNDVTISASLNIVSLALGPRVKKNNERIVVNEDREVFYAPLSSFHLYSISSAVLRNQEFARNEGEYQGTVKDYGQKSSQSVGMVMDNQGMLYYSLLSINSVARWDSNTPFQFGQRIIAKDDTYLEWVNSFSLDDKGNLTILVNRLNRFIYGKLKTNEVNFRLISSNVGGMGYLYDEIYNYNISTTTEQQSTTTTTEKAAAPALKPGTDQDPYLAPQPASEPEPTPEPSSSPTPLSTSTPKSETPSSLRSILDSTTQGLASAASKRREVAVLAFLTAGMLFVV